MPKRGPGPEDLTGQQFNHLTAIEYAGQVSNRSAWRCRCSCGNITVVGARHLKYGSVISCGCVVLNNRKKKKEAAAARSPSLCTHCKKEEARPDRKTCQTCADYFSNRPIDIQRRARRIRKERWQNWIKEIKNKPCMDCGGSFAPENMDFHHRVGEIKETNVAKMITDRVSKKRILAEIAKCDLLCRPCHMARTDDHAQRRLDSL